MQGTDTRLNFSEAGKDSELTWLNKSLTVYSEKHCPVCSSVQTRDSSLEQRGRPQVIVITEMVSEELETGQP